MTAVPRLVVTDLDGTFLSPDGTVSAANAAAVRDWCASGRHFLVATGRPVRALGPILDIHGIRPTVIASNGAVLFDCDTGEILSHQPLDTTVTAEVVAAIRTAIPGTSFAIEYGWRYGHEPHYLRHPDLPVDDPECVGVGAIEGLFDHAPMVKLLVQHLGLHADELARRATEVTGDRLTVTYSSGSQGLLELSSPGVSKASTLATLCGSRGIAASEVASFGDMPNDRAMLDWSGHPHVMANAHPDVLGRGTVIGTNLESAVGAVLTAWLSI